MFENITWIASESWANTPEIIKHFNTLVIYFILFSAKEQALSNQYSGDQGSNIILKCLPYTLYTFIVYTIYTTECIILYHNGYLSYGDITLNLISIIPGVR